MQKFVGSYFILIHGLKLESFPLLHYVARHINNVFEFVCEEVQRLIMWHTL
jgi:hypothetical protein